MANFPPVTLRNGAATGVASYKANSNQVSINASAAQTFAVVIGCKAAFQGIQVALQNFDTANPLVVRAKAAPTGKSAEPGNGTGVNALAYQDLTVGGSTTITIPAATRLAPPANATAPQISDYNNNIGQVIPGVVMTDFIPMRALARTDGGTDSLLYLRIYSAGNLSLCSIDTSVPSWADYGVYYAQSKWPGDVVTTTTVAMTPIIPAATNDTYGVSTRTLFLPTLQVDFFTGGKTARIAVFGDSLSAGTLVSGANWESGRLAPGVQGTGAHYADEYDHTNWSLMIAPAFRAIGYPNVLVANHACGGQKRDVTSAVLQATCAQIKPDIAVMWNRSVNSGEYTPEQQFKFLISDLEFCRARGIKPVVVAMHPDDTDTSFIRNYLKGWGVFIDLPALLRFSAASPVISSDRLNPLPNGALNASWDATHLSYDGNKRLAAYAAPLIAALL